MTYLEERDQAWTAYLKGENTLPLIGLAPMSEQEEKEISIQAKAWIAGDVSRWRRLFEVYPAATFAWLGCAAGVAYEEGTFWPVFEQRTGLNGAFATPNKRAELASRFTKVAASFAMPLPPPTTGTFSLVRSLLFFAGFPVCHSATFANEVRAIQRDAQLPDSDTEDAGEELCELLRSRLRRRALPTLKKSLDGPAGPILCEVALSVLFSGDFSQINPRIGQELQTAFENAKPVRGAATFHAPYLRLATDLQSLELVCPAQDSQLVPDPMIRWVVDGQIHVAPSREDFVVPIAADQQQCIVEAVGLREGRTISREINLPTNPKDVWVFAGLKRKLKKVLPLQSNGVSLACGNYYILFPTSATWGDHGAYCWPAHGAYWSARNLEIRPTTDYQLSCENLDWRIKGEPIPSFWPEGQCFVSGEGHRVFYGETSMQVWWPGDEEVISEEWSLKVRRGQSETSLQIPATSTDGGSTTSLLSLNGTAFFDDLPAGVSSCDVALMHRNRCRAKREMFFWKGLDKYDENPQEFVLSKAAKNLIAADCVGFGVQEGRIQFVESKAPNRKLLFDLGDQQQLVLSWRNLGTFLESFDREPGKSSSSICHALGTVFPASLHSKRFLRIWADDDFGSLTIGGEDELVTARAGVVELSLAELSTRFPQGGGIALKGKTVAGFTSPLVPLTVSRVTGDKSRGLDFAFREEIAGARVLVQEMTEQISHGTEVHWFDEQDEVSVSIRGLPSLKLSRKKNEDGVHLAIEAPIKGWKMGVWIVLVEVCRRNTDQPEPIVFARGQKSPLLIIAQPEEDDHSSAPPLMLALSKAWRKTLGGDAVAGGLDIGEYIDAVPSLLEFLRRWHRFFDGDFSDGIKRDFEWIDVLEKAIANLGEERVRQGDSAGAHWLLNLANTHSGKRRLLRTPEVLCLPASEYSDLPEGEPLLDSLTCLSRFSEFDFAAEANFEMHFSLDFLKHFKNCFEVSAGNAEEFGGFALAKYWEELSKVDFDGQPTASQSDYLGGTHWRNAITSFYARYTATQNRAEAEWGPATSYLRHGVQPLVDEVKIRVGNRIKLPEGAFLHLAPALEIGNALVEETPRFCSAWALTNRLSASGVIKFESAYQQLTRAVGGEDQCRMGVRVLLEVCPELFGFFLLFWEFQIKIHRDQ